MRRESLERARALRRAKDRAREIKRETFVLFVPSHCDFGLAIDSQVVT